MTANVRESLIDELEQAIHHDGNGRSAEVLRRVTGLLLSFERFDEEQAALFDNVVGHLVDQIETRALLELSGRLASPGARPSNSGFDMLAGRAEDDGVLAESIAARPDVPLHVFCAFLVRATDAVRQRLLAAARPEAHAEICRVVAKVSGEVAAQATIARDYATALRNVLLKYAAGQLGEREVLDFARARRFEETVAALSLFCSVPVEIVDRIICGKRIEPVLILCRAAGFEWPTARAIIQLYRRKFVISSDWMIEACDDFKRLSNGTAQKVLRFWQNHQATAET